MTPRKAAPRKATTRKAKTRNPDETRGALLNAAEAEFNAHGYQGTDTNRIARRAGYAPQTFYRHYSDKMAAFLAVYERWWTNEADAVGAILRVRGPADLGRVADTLIAFHTKWRGFRRALRHLSSEEPRVRAARVTARKAQVVVARTLLAKSRRSESQIYGALLILERLCDAVAEGEFADMGFAKSDARKAVISALLTVYEPA
jgi:AcrR family transcriptional regulator